MASSPRTLAIDIGGTGLKALVLDVDGAPITSRERVETPDDSSPKHVLAGVESLVRHLGPQGSTRGSPP